jgi:hypothetical protein
MMEKRIYKGSLIDARALPVWGGGWTAHFSIAKNVGNETQDTPFVTGQMFDSEKAALQAAIQLACLKVDSGYTPFFL